MPDEILAIDRDGAVAVVTLNRPYAGNALSRSLQDEIVKAFTTLGEDDAIQAIVLTGAGERVFCAGLDLRELAAGIDLINGDCDPVAAITDCTKPVIAAVNGAAVTGGLELALACDIVLGSTNARFADSHARMGVIPGWGLSQRLQRVIGPGRAREMALTGHFIDAETASRWGLVNHLYAAHTLLPSAIAMAVDIASWDALFIARYRKLMTDGAKLSLGEALLLERHAAKSYNTPLSNNRGRKTGAMIVGGCEP